MAKAALIVGAGTGISASFARKLNAAGYRVAVASRSPDKLAHLTAEAGAQAWAVDSTNVSQVAELFREVEDTLGPLDAVLYNAAQRVRGPITDIDPVEVHRAIEVTAFGGFVVAQQAAKRMVPRRHGTIMFTGASASVKGYPQSATFAMGKFALRGLAQSMARELQPKGIHVVHFVIDGGVRNAARGRVEDPDAPDSLLDPDAIADSYMHILTQPRSAWSWEIELRPWVERF